MMRGIEPVLAANGMRVHPPNSFRITCLTDGCPRLITVPWTRLEETLKDQVEKKEMVGHHTSEKLGWIS